MYSNRPRDTGEFLGLIATISKDVDIDRFGLILGNKRQNIGLDRPRTVMEDYL